MSPTLPLLGALCAAGAVWLVVPDRRQGPRRLARVLPAPAGRTTLVGAPVDSIGPPSSRLSRLSRGRRTTPRARQAGALAGVAVASVVGGWPGVVAGVLLAGALGWWLPRLEPRASRQRRDRLSSQAAEVADLLAACLASGATLAMSVSAVAAAVGPPARDSLMAVAAQGRLGSDTLDSWRALAVEPAFAPLSRAVVRSSESGAPVVDSLVRAGDDLRSRRRGELLVSARVAGVRAVLPLGLCFLPAFALLGVVPVVVSLVSSVLVT